MITKSFVIGVYYPEVPHVEAVFYLGFYGRTGLARVVEHQQQIQRTELELGIQLNGGAANSLI